MTQWVAQARESFTGAFLRQITVWPNATIAGGVNTSIVGLAYRDLYPANFSRHGNLNAPPSAQVEAAAGMVAMDAALATDPAGSHRRGALGSMLAALVLNASTEYRALQAGGVIDMAQLGRSLVSYGRPDAAFGLLSTDGPTSLYHMAKSTGTLWAHPGGADGDRGKCSSHNHVMQGGSVGESLFGIGGIQPSFVRTSGSVTDGIPSELPLVLAPVPWLPEAPLGAAVWRALSGVVSTRWAARVDNDTGNWSAWVNVTVPVDTALAQVHDQHLHGTCVGARHNVHSRHRGIFGNAVATPSPAIPPCSRSNAG